MSGIFVCYRRSDAQHPAGRLVEVLGRTFDKDQLFIDVDKIELGLDFNRELARRLSDCVVMLVLIGPSWLNASEEDGTRRLDNPDDYVRKEIEQALARDIRVIPVLVDGARMPRSSELPETLRPLISRQATEIKHQGFNPVVNALAETLKKIMAPGDGPARDETNGGPAPFTAPRNVAPPPKPLFEGLPPAIAASLARMTGKTSDDSASQASNSAPAAEKKDASPAYAYPSWGTTSPQPTPAHSKIGQPYAPQFDPFEPQKAPSSFYQAPAYGQPSELPSTGYEQTAEPEPDLEYAEEDEPFENAAPRRRRGSQSWIGLLISVTAAITAYLSSLAFDYIGVADSGWTAALVVGLIVGIGGLTLLDETDVLGDAAIPSLLFVSCILAGLLLHLYGWWGAAAWAGITTAHAIQIGSSGTQRDGGLLALWSMMSPVIGVCVYHFAANQGWSLPSLWLTSDKLPFAAAGVAMSLWQALIFVNHLEGDADGMARALIPLPVLATVLVLFGIEGAGAVAVGLVLLWMIWVSLS